MATITGTEPVVQPFADDVLASAPTARWAVHEHAWKELVPALSDEVIGLVAPSLVVCAQPR